MIDWGIPATAFAPAPYVVLWLSIAIVYSIQLLFLPKFAEGLCRGEVAIDICRKVNARGRAKRSIMAKLMAWV